MNPEAFAQVEQLYHMLLALEPEQRNARLAAVSDARLRHEVERLLQANEPASAFLQIPVGAVPDLLDPAPLPRLLGHYRLKSLLGKGGMGEVYLAEDTRLHRKVAIKLLPTNFTSEADRVRRFEREAIAASALNHPNILTVYEIGHEQNTHFMATEYIAGTTLRQRLSEMRLPLRTVLDIAAQTASALVAAHEAGIIHRDIKPENVMLRSDGIVKVLDFGLAKLAETRNAERGTRNEEAETLIQNDSEIHRSSLRDHHSTEPGTVMGTASYMSPEQARGQEVDARSDIFSLGVLLYEMLAGRAPFAGVNSIDVLGAILHQEPVPLGQLVTSLPAELQRIVSKALRKDRDERYQHSKDLWLDLNDLRRELEFEEKLKARQLPTTETGEQAPPTPTVAIATPPATDATTQPTVSSAKIILSELKRHKTGAMLGLAAVVLLLGSAAFGLYKLFSSGATKSTPSVQALKFTRLTAHGQAVAAAVSPDGKYVVYAKQEPTGQSLWLRQVALNNSDVQIVPPQETEYRSFTYSPDGNFIYYVAGGMDAPASLYRMSALGRNSTLLISNHNSFGLTFSPDGQRIAFMRNYAARKNELFVANTEGKEERLLATGNNEHDLFRTVAWAPDGERIACSSIVKGDGQNYQTVVGVNAETGAFQPLTPQRWSNIGQLHWLPQGNGLIVLASELSNAYEAPITANFQLWQLAVPDGEVSRLTNDLNNYDSLSLTADARSFIALRKEDSWNLWVAPKGDSNRAQQLPRMGKGDGVRGLAWTPDGRIVYCTTVAGQAGIWMTNADGGNQKQIGSGNGRKLAVSPDGRWVVFPSLGKDDYSLWQMELASGALKQLAKNEDIYGNASYTPDGKWLLYVRRYENKLSLWKVSVDGGAPVPILDQLPSLPSPTVSPDGKLIAYFGLNEQRRRVITVMSYEGGSMLKTFDVPPTIYTPAGLQWMPDRHAITYVSTRNGVSNIWGQSLDGGAPKQLTNFQSEQIRAFAWSRDGQLAVSRGVVTSDVVLITDFK